MVERFWVLGGECNYLLGCAAVPGEDGRLRHALHPNPRPPRARAAREASALPLGTFAQRARAPALRYELQSREAQWLACGIWTPDDGAVQAMLDAAEASLQATMREMQLRNKIIRKPRAIGIVPGGKTGKLEFAEGHGSTTMNREALDEVVLRLHADLNQHAKAQQGPPLPFCAFNGGGDVWMDVGNKRIGVDGLRKLLAVPSESVLHVGDQFLNTGNDYAARNGCPCLWIINEKETRQVLKHILKDALGLPRSELKEQALLAPKPGESDGESADTDEEQPPAAAPTIAA